MNASCLVDTNVVVYAYDRTEPAKQLQAFQVMDQLAASARGALSVQVLAESFAALTRKIRAPLRPKEAYQRIQNYQQSWPVLDLTGLIALEAARGVVDHRLNFWDSLIWATARLNQVRLVLSEDFSSGAAIEGVRFENPFAEGFTLQAVLA
jgi:predicted nucleic acid-binding protein